MDSGDSKISMACLDDIAETLLIPLSARVLAPRLNPDLGFRDPMAEALFGRLDVDPGRFVGDRASMRGSVVRARWFDKVARAFLDRHPDGLVVSMGSGLDARAQRIGYRPRNGGAWIDLDRPEVVELRRTLLPVAPSVGDLAADLNETGWLQQLPWRQGQPALFLAEGVMMYLEPRGAEGLVRAIGKMADQRGGAIELAFDYASRWMVRNSGRHPSVKKTNARFSWALDRPSDLENLDRQLCVAEQSDITAKSGTLPALMGKLHRLFTGREIYACARFDRAPAT